MLTAKEGEEERTRAEAHDAMLQEALSRPGVREFMEVYQNWRKAESGIDHYRRTVKRRGKVTTSDRTSSL